MLRIAGKSVLHPRELQRGPVFAKAPAVSRFVATCGCGPLYVGPDGQVALGIATEHSQTTGHTANLHGEVRK